MKLGILSFNDTLILEPYQQGQGLKEEVRSGFAFVKQKSELFGLKVLVEAKLSDGTYIPAGSTAYISEELLSSQQWAKNAKTCAALGEQKFILVEMKYVNMIDPNEFVVDSKQGV
jgi:hypothetical protein